MGRTSQSPRLSPDEHKQPIEASHLERVINMAQILVTSFGDVSPTWDVVYTENLRVYVYLAAVHRSTSGSVPVVRTMPIVDRLTPARVRKVGAIRTGEFLNLVENLF